VKHPEADYHVTISPNDVIECRRPDGVVERVPMAEARAIHVETNDSGPWGADVWWLVEGPSGQIELAFPQLATGEDEALNRFHQLAGFQIKGMNSVANARFECWRAPG
jgi:hypothetical protein